MQFFIKTIVSALIIATISTVSKKLPTFGAIIASLPLTSILAMIWLYQDTKDVNKVIELSTAIFWIVIPSLIFFIAFSMLLKRNISFYPSLVVASIIMIVSYYIYIMILRLLKVKGM